MPLAEVALFGVLGAMTFALQVVMSPLPNIEPVSLLTLVFMAVFGWNSFEKLRAAFAERHAYLKNGLENAHSEEELRVFWDEYRHNYYREENAGN